MSDSLTEQEAREAVLRLQQERSEIKQQIDSAKRTAWSTGVYADARWMTSAEYAFRAKGVEIKKLEYQLSTLKAARKQSVKESFDSRFVESAKRLLPPEVFQQISTAATVPFSFPPTTSF